MATDSYAFLGEHPNTAEKAEALRTIPLLRDLGDAYVMGLARHAKYSNAAPGDVLVRQGDPGDSLILIVGGDVLVDRNGKQVAQMGAGDFFGEMSLIDGEPRSATVIAKSPVRMVSLDSSMFQSMLESDPDLWRKLLHVLAARLRARNEGPAD